jgi:nucleoside-diphosphate-sugar epimerase
MKKKILITGISSALMRKLCLLIDPSGYEIIGISRHPESVRLQNIQVLKGDLSAIHELAPYFRDCYMVIHGAALTHSRSSKAYFKVNLEATKKLVDMARENGVLRFVFISSNTAGLKSGAYGLTKHLAEEYIRDHANRWTILRLSEIYGGDKSEGIEKTIHVTIDKSMVFCPVGVPSRFHPIHMDDAVRIIHHRIFSEERGNAISVINGPEGFSYREIITLIERLMGKRIRVIPLGKRTMMLIKLLARILPVNVGLVPDQVDRLYAAKHFEVPEGSLMKLEIYLMKLIVEAKTN